MGPRVHLGAEVDGRRKGRLPKDDGVFPEEDQFPGAEAAISGDSPRPGLTFRAIS